MNLLPALEPRRQARWETAYLTFSVARTLKPSRSTRRVAVWFSGLMVHQAQDASTDDGELGSGTGRRTVRAGGW
jgi:hypothetical protein